MAKPHILICIPTRGYICQELFNWCGKMIRRSENPNNAWTCKIPTSKGGHQNPNVNELLAYSIEVEKNFTHWLKMDDDLVPDDDLIDRLLAMNKPFIGVGIGIFRESHNPPAFLAIYNIDPITLFYEQPDLEANRQGKCDYVGGGCMMLEYTLCKKLYDEALDTDIPIWDYKHTFRGQFIGSDELFCQKLKKMGYEVWYDATLPIPQHTDVLVTVGFNGGLKTVNLSYRHPPSMKKRDPFIKVENNGT